MKFDEQPMLIWKPEIKSHKICNNYNLPFYSEPLNLESKYQLIVFYKIHTKANVENQITKSLSTHTK
jgi:hypothetical protein